jgi:peptidyl-prolyl cis-trans isomerase C
MIRLFSMMVGCTVLLFTSGCARKRAGGETVLAQVDDRLITAADLDRRVGETSPLARARGGSTEKRNVLGNMVDREVIAAEARRRGYDRRPDIQRIVDDYMSATLVRDEVDAKLKPEDVPDADIERYFREHQREFSRPEELRASAILIKDKAKAERVAVEARAAGKDADRFRLLVAKHSEDPASKPRGGDLGIFDRSTARHPKAAVEAAFALQNPGDVSPPVVTDRGFYIIKLDQRRPGFSRPINDVKDQIRRQLLSEVRARKIGDLVARLRAEHKVKVFEDRLPAGTPGGALR